jgi:hypothetical protein
MVGMTANKYQHEYIGGRKNDLLFDDFEHAWINNGTDEESYAPGVAPMSMPCFHTLAVLTTTLRVSMCSRAFYAPMAIKFWLKQPFWLLPRILSRFDNVEGEFHARLYPPIIPEVTLGWAKTETKQLALSATHR